jgi:hypothetical protein
MTGRTTRPLTNDERKAAEAAFRGEPFNSEWSQSAREMYDGISAVLALRTSEKPSSSEQSEEFPLEPAHTR